MAANVEALQIVLASLCIRNTGSDCHLTDFSHHDKQVKYIFIYFSAFRLPSDNSKPRIFCRHNRKSFQAMFLYLAFLWMLLRTIFFSNARHYQNLSVDVLLWTPYTISFLTFSLIAVFYAKMFYADEWRTYRMYVWGSFGVVNATVAGLTIGIIIHSCTEEVGAYIPC
eukprot:1324638-Amorphochlora_amoeboformis.AAC.1